ncbi:hypothetical protein [Streptomyces sp. NPDC053048]|uniref:hypothetical protein n=1 Tax=Streptomyces sp. NPDC053048 TaxID=3365694 RepID=UPI0037D58772
MNSQPTERPPAGLMVQRDNEVAVTSLLNRTSLHAPTIFPRPHAVHVVVNNVDDIGDWLTSLGGEIKVRPSGDGLEVWTLHTSTPRRADGSSVAVLVSAVLPEGELVFDYIRAAVTR